MRGFPFRPHEVEEHRSLPSAGDCAERDRPLPAKRWPARPCRAGCRDMIDAIVRRVAAGTLHRTCMSRQAFTTSLMGHFDPTPFKESRGTKDFKHLVEAFGSKSWQQMFDFVCWYAEWLNP